MPVISTKTDPTNLTLTIVFTMAANADRVWRLWSDPRQLEKWWGPPQWPATFYRYDFAVDGQCAFYMTGPDGTKMHGWWRITALAEPHHLELHDGFADENGEPTGEHGITDMVVTMEPVDTGTRMTVVSRFESELHLEEMLAMGMEQGMTEAMGQIDAVLAT